MGLFVVCGHQRGEKFSIRVVDGELELADRFVHHKGTNIRNGRVITWTRAWVAASLKTNGGRQWLYWHIVPGVNVRMIEWRSFQVYGEFSILRRLQGDKAYTAWQTAKKQSREERT